MSFYLPPPPSNLRPPTLFPPFPTAALDNALQGTRATTWPYLTFFQQTSLRDKGFSNSSVNCKTEGGEHPEAKWKEAGLIINEYDGIGGTLLLTCSTFNTLLRINRFWPLTNQLINLARANLYANTTARASPLIKLGMHGTSLQEKTSKVEPLQQDQGIPDPPPRLNGLYPFYLGHLLLEYPLHAHLEGHL